MPPKPELICWILKKLSGGGVMFLPYLRIVPMHLALIIGLSAGYAGGMLLFATLKTLADALMHWIEYRISGASAASPA